MKQAEAAESARRRAESEKLEAQKEKKKAQEAAKAAESAKRWAESKTLEAHKEKEKAQAAIIAREIAIEQAIAKAKEAKEAKEDALEQKEAAVAQRRRAELDIACSSMLMRQVDVEVTVVNLTVSAPPGVAIFPGPSRKAEAHRCPNIDACAASALALQPLENDSSCALPPGSKAQCDAAYGASYPGCHSCSAGHGRANSDPFSCSPCGSQSVQWTVWLAQPLALFAISLNGAEKARASNDTRAAYSNDVLKILLAFSAGVIFLATSMESTAAFRALPGPWKEAMSNALGTAAITSGDSSSVSMLYTSSVDCLLHGGQRPASITLKLQVAALQAAVVLGLSLVYVAAKTAVRGGSFKSRALTVVIVAGNQFLPGIAAICFQAVPCFHTQTGGGSFLLAYDPAVECSDANRLKAILLVCPVLLVTVVAGPFFWVLVLRGSSARRPLPSAVGAGERDGQTAGEGQTDGEEDYSLAFLTSSYQEKFKYWEACRLSKTMALASIATVSPATYCPGQKLALALAVMGPFLAGHCTCSPYASRVLNRIELMSLAVLVEGNVAVGFLTGESWSNTPHTEAAVLLCTAWLLFVTLCVLIATFIHSRVVRTETKEEELQQQEEEGGLEEFDKAGQEDFFDQPARQQQQQQQLEATSRDAPPERPVAAAPSEGAPAPAAVQAS